MKQVPILSILIAVLILITASTAGAVSNAAVLYLRVAAGARPAGMGEAFVSIADDATATYWNPAGLGNAPVAGRLETKKLPYNFDEITDVVTMKSYNRKTETWVISGNQLAVYDGKTWNTGRQYMTSSDQTLSDFLQTILKVNDPDTLKMMASRVVDANCDYSADDIDSFIEMVRANTPEGYAESEDLKRGLDTLKAGYAACLLNNERFKSLRERLNDNMKDSVMTGEELDKITFSLEQALLRFLPSRLTVPYAAGIAGKMICLGNTGNYLWVGTDNGLYRHSALSWARYTTEHNLPSDTILSLAEEDERLLIGTVAGVAEYYHGSFNVFPDLPKSPVTAISFSAPEMAYAVIGNVIYRYDGKTWSDSFPYKVRIDDSIDKIVERIGVYHTDAEYEYLEQKIRSLNAGKVPVSPEVAAVEEETATLTEAADMTDVDEDVVDTTAIGEDVDEAIATDEEVVEGEPEAPVEEVVSSEPWLVEGNTIQLPISPVFRYEVSAMYADDVHDVIWVGTTSGLLSFTDGKWERYGYSTYVVPGPDSTGQTVSMTAEEIARDYFPISDSTRIKAIAKNIDEYNDLDGQPISSGDAVFVYSHNTGSAIHSIGEIFGELYVGTEYSLEKKSWEGWETVEIGGMKGERYEGVYDFDGQAYYISSSGLGVETKGRREFVVMFVKWLPTLDLDMYYGFLSYVHNARGLGTFGISAIYLSYGSIEFTDESGQNIGQGNPFEFSLALSYGTSVSSRFKLGGTVKVIHSHLSSIGAGQEQGSGIAWAFAVDAGMLLKITNRLQLGSAVTNLGPDISYIDAAQADPLPRNLAVGLSYRVWDTPYNSLVVHGEMNKILTNLNKGIGTEMEYAIRHIGAEYWYSDFIAVRAGYKYDKEGQVKHLTFGAGLQYDALRFDLAYVPSSVDSPLANTLRISFSLML